MQGWIALIGKEHCSDALEFLLIIISNTDLYRSVESDLDFSLTI